MYTDYKKLRSFFCYSKIQVYRNKAIFLFLFYAACVTLDPTFIVIVVENHH